MTKPKLIQHIIFYYHYFQWDSSMCKSHLQLSVPYYAYVQQNIIKMSMLSNYFSTITFKYINIRLNQ